MMPNCIESSRSSDFPQTFNEDNSFLQSIFSPVRNENFTKPTKVLFVKKAFEKKKEYDIDVETIPDPSQIVYDEVKTKFFMNLCDRHASQINYEHIEKNPPKKNCWTFRENRVFKKMMKILDHLHLAKLTQKGSNNEPILRRNSVDKATQQVRKLFSTTNWDETNMKWLHEQMIQTLDEQYLSNYFDVVQTLAVKFPDRIARMIDDSDSERYRTGPLSKKELSQLFEKKWSPVLTSTLHVKQLPKHPIIIFIQPLTITRKWIELLSLLATTVAVSIKLPSPNITEYLDHIFCVTQKKIRQVKSNHPTREIILVGFNATASLALHLAKIEPVLCVISLGFSILTYEGKRGDNSDIMLDVDCPVLFVIGQCSNTTSREDMEDLRERMRGETELIIVDSGDNHLRISKKKKSELGVTQSYADKCIIEEIRRFITNLILYPPVKPPKQKPKRGRPPGSKNKPKLEHPVSVNNFSNNIQHFPQINQPKTNVPVGNYMVLPDGTVTLITRVSNENNNVQLPREESTVQLHQTEQNDVRDEGNGASGNSNLLIVDESTGEETVLTEDDEINLLLSELAENKDDNDERSSRTAMKKVWQKNDEKENGSDCDYVEDDDDDDADEDYVPPKRFRV